MAILDLNQLDQHIAAIAQLWKRSTRSSISSGLPSSHDGSDSNSLITENQLGNWGTAATSWATIEFIDSIAAKVVSRISGQTFDVSGISFAPDGSRLAVVSRRLSVCLLPSPGRNL